MGEKTPRITKCHPSVWIRLRNQARRHPSASRSSAWYTSPPPSLGALLQISPMFFSTWDHKQSLDGGVHQGGQFPRFPPVIMLYVSRVRRARILQGQFGAQSPKPTEFVLHGPDEPLATFQRYAQNRRSATGALRLDWRKTARHFALPN